MRRNTAGLRPEDHQTVKLARLPRVYVPTPDEELNELRCVMALASEQPAVPCPTHQIPQGGRPHDWPILADEPRDVIQAAAKAVQMRFCFSFFFSLQR
jgi:hypothetical protein